MWQTRPIALDVRRRREAALLGNLADEPLRGIPPKDAEELTAVLSDLAASGAAVVVTGHEVAALLHAADHVSWCTSGTTYQLVPPGVAVQHDQFPREYLGTWSTL